MRRECEPSEGTRQSCKACPSLHLACSLAKGKGVGRSSGGEQAELLTKLLHLAADQLSVSAELVDEMKKMNRVLRSVDRRLAASERLAREKEVKEEEEEEEEEEEGIDES